MFGGWLDLENFSCVHILYGMYVYVFTGYKCFLSGLWLDVEDETGGLDEEWSHIQAIMKSYGCGIARESVFMAELEQEFREKLGES